MYLFMHENLLDIDEHTFGNSIFKMAFTYYRY